MKITFLKVVLEIFKKINAMIYLDPTRVNKVKTQCDNEFWAFFYIS